MTWQTFSKLRFYASAGIALVGLSAASAWLTTSTTQAQDPPAVKERISEAKEAMKVEIGKQLAELKGEEVTTAATLGDSHPKVISLRAKIAALEALLEGRNSANQAKATVATTKAAQEKASKALSIARSANAFAGEMPPQAADIITDNVLGTTSRVIVRQTEDGDTVREVHTMPATVGSEYRVAQGFPAFRALTLEGNKEARELQQLVDKLKSKEASEDDKKAARAKAEELLSKQFDEDVTQREQQITELEKQLSTLKEQVAKRRDAKKRLMELRMELLINESEGLGFPNAWQTQARFGAPSSPLAPVSVPGMRYISPSSVVTVPGMPVPPAVAPVPPTPPVAPVAPVAPSAPAPAE